MTTKTDTAKKEITNLPDPKNFDPSDFRYRQYPLFKYLDMAFHYNFAAYEIYLGEKKINPTSDLYLDSLWHFVRAAKGHPALADCRPGEALANVRHWLKQLDRTWTSFSGIDSVEDGDIEFLALWEKMRYAAGESPLTLALDAAMD